MKSNLSLWLALGFLGLCSLNPLQGEETAPSLAMPHSPWISIPSGIEINSRDQMLRFPVEVVNDNGGLEFILTIGKDKDYESLFACSFKAQDLHLAMLMISACPQGNIELQPSLGSRVKISVTMAEQTYPIESWLSWSNDQPVKDLGLYFHGSAFAMSQNKKIYLADQSLNAVAAWASHDMVLGPSVKVGNPYIEDDTPYLRPCAKLPHPKGSKGSMLIELLKP